MLLAIDSESGYETPFTSPARVDRLAGEHEPGGAARTHEARQQSRFDHRRDAQAHFRHRKARALGGDAQIACGGDLEARADHRAMQPRDDRERKPSDRLAHGVDLLDEGAGVGSIQRGKLLHLRAAAERLAAAAQYHDADFPVFSHNMKGF